MNDKLLSAVLGGLTAVEDKASRQEREREGSELHLLRAFFVLER